MVVIKLLMGTFRVGFVAKYLSDPLIEGFLVATAFQGITSQVKYMLGLRIPRTFGMFRILKVRDLVWHELDNMLYSYFYHTLFGKPLLNNMFNNVVPVNVNSMLYIRHENQLNQPRMLWHNLTNLDIFQK